MSQLMNVVNSQMEKISEWFRANMLSLNEKKSNFMIFRPRQKRQTIELLLKINGQKIDNVKETMFLGVILDEHTVCLGKVIYHILQVKYQSP